MKHSSISIFVLLAIFSFLPAFGQETETQKIEIPALDQMHKSIHPLWHKAYPNKDSDLLKSLYPDLEKDYQNLKSAEFPPQWPDRKMHWEQGLEQMGNVLASYKKAMDANDDEALLKSARDMHDAYESLVNIVNPPVPAMDAFHKVMFHVFHDYLPTENWEKINEAIPQFQQEMEGLNTAELPRRFASRQEAFDQHRKELSDAVADLGKLHDSKDHEKVKEAIEKVHKAYEGLEKSLD